MNTDDSLVFGLLAIQSEYLDEDRLVQVWQAWQNDQSVPLSQFLVRADWMDEPARAEVERLMQRKLLRYGGDIRAFFEPCRTRQSDRALPVAPEWTAQDPSGPLNALVQQSLCPLPRSWGPRQPCHRRRTVPRPCVQIHSDPPRSESSDPHSLLPTRTQ